MSGEISSEPVKAPRSRYQMRPRAEQEQLKTDIIKHLASGLTDKQIYDEVLKIPERTYYNYLDKVIEEHEANFTRQRRRIVYGIIQRTTRRIQACHRHYAQTNNPKYLRDAQQADMELADFLFKIGVLDKVPEKFSIEQTLFTIKKPEWLETTAEVLDGTKDSGTTGTTPPAIPVHQKPKQV
jgi:hypothetical protein